MLLDDKFLKIYSKSDGGVKNIQPLALILFKIYGKSLSDGLSKGVGTQFVEDGGQPRNTLTAAMAPNSLHVAGPPLPTLTPMDVGANGTLLKYQTLPANSPNSTPATSTYGVKSYG